MLGLAGLVALYRKYVQGKAPLPVVSPSAPIANPVPALPPAPAPAPVNYDPGTLSGPNPGDVNGLPTYNPAASVTSTPDTSGGGVDTSSTTVDPGSYLGDVSSAGDVLSSLFGG